MELTDDDVLEILKLFEHSKFDFLQLEQGERKITISKGGFGLPAGSASPTAVPASTPPSTRASVAAAPASPAPAPSAGGAATSVPTAAPRPQASPADAGLVAVTAPMVGKFYAAASPADPPYVQAGSAVEVGATLGLIEVMKVFASIKTETAGTVEKILVTTGEFVEFGQTLFLIRP